MNDITVGREMLQRMINAIDMLIPTLPGLRDKGSVWLRDEIIKSADELRAALAGPVVKENLTTEYDQTALELCKVCGWKAVIPTEGCLNCEREKQLMKKPPAEPVVELMNWRWFTHSEESGYQPRKTRKEAIDAASHELSEERGNANIEGEWSSNAESIVWGCVMGGVKAQQDESGSVDMRLELAAIEAPPAEPAVEPVAKHCMPHGWVINWPHPDGGTRPVYHPSSIQPKFGDMKPTMYPVYTSPPPPAEPAVEPFGYFRAEPFGWTDCAPTDEGAKALYEAPPPADRPLTDDAIAEAMANVWGCASIAPRQAPEFARAIERFIKGARP